MRIALFAPLSPMRGGVVDYREELLPHLARHCDIDVYTRDDIAAQAKLGDLHIFGHREFQEHDRRESYPQVIYQLGCSRDHVPDYEFLMQRPGLSVLHEMNLAGIIGGLTFERGRPREYLRAVRKNEGIGPAASVMWRFIRTRSFPGYLAFNFNRLAFVRSQGLIVHSEYMRRAVTDQLARYRARRPIYTVNMGMRPVPALDQGAIRAELGIESGTFVLGSFGVVHESKGILTALMALRRLLDQVPDAIYLLVGIVESESLPHTIRAMGLGDRVRLTGYVAMNDLYRYATAIDVCLNLRLPRTGGTSASLLRLMSLGRPVIISDYGQFAEIPDEVCLKVTAGDGAPESVLAHLLDLAAHRDRGRLIGERARRFVAEFHSLEGAAAAYWDAIRASVSLGAEPAMSARVTTAHLGSKSSYR